MRRRGDHGMGYALQGREDMLAQWGPPCAAMEKIDREEGNLRSTVNSALGYLYRVSKKKSICAFNLNINLWLPYHYRSLGHETEKENKH